MTIVESFGAAIRGRGRGRGRGRKVKDARTEVGKWRHPVEAEIAGISWNITKKIARLEELKSWMEAEVKGEIV